MSQNPHFVLLVSGKRKSGKDYIARKLLDTFDENIICAVTLSAPLKGEYAKEHGLDLTRLMDSSSYKEEFRQSMISWGEKMRKQDDGYFCRKAIEKSDAFSKPIWIVTDTRRRSDVTYFQREFGNRVMTLRITASEDARKKRHWEFTPGIDDVESECDLDDFIQWDWIISNNGDEMDEINSNKILQEIKTKIIKCKQIPRN